MQSPQFIVEFNRYFDTKLAAIPEFGASDYIGRQASEFITQLVSQHQQEYDVPRTIRFGIVDGEKFVHRSKWVALAMWPDGTLEDWVVINSSFVTAAFERADAVVRPLLRIDRASVQPGGEVTAGLARAKSCRETILSFIVCHELAHHGFGHQLLYKPTKTISGPIERAVEFAADVHGFRCAAVRSLAFQDGDGGFADPEGQILAIRNAAAYMVAVLPLLTVLRSRHSLRDMNENGHPYFGYRALLAHQIWVNEAKMRAPYMDFVDLDEMFINMLKQVCAEYVSNKHPEFFESLAAQISERTGTNRLTQSLGYMSALYGIPPDWIRDMRACHDQAVPIPNRHARGKYFSEHPYDLVM